MRDRIELMRGMVASSLANEEELRGQVNEWRQLNEREEAELQEKTEKKKRRRK